MDEAQLIDFLKKAKTRSGVGFKVEYIQKDSFGNILYLKGYIMNMSQSQEIKTDVYWNVVGVAINTSPIIYDLVEELAITYTEEGNAEHEPPPQGQ